MKSVIGIKYEDGIIRAIRVDQEGYPGYTGAILLGKYQDQKKIEELLELGNLVLLGENINPSPSKPHYITKIGQRECKELQEQTTVAKYRDTRKYVAGEYKEGRKHRAKLYKLEVDIYWVTKVPYIYIFDEKTKCWDTNCISSETGQFMNIHTMINYRSLIENLIMKGIITDLTKEERDYVITHTKKHRSLQL